MAQLSNAGATLLRTEGETQTWGNGFHHHPWYIRNILGPDGKRRTAYLGPDADTFFSWPARMKIRGQWIPGFVSGPDVSDELQEPRFHAQHNGHANGETPGNCRGCHANYLPSPNAAER